MYLIEAVKNLHSYLFLGRCRRHDRALTVVQADGHYASTMPVCTECHPHYRQRSQAAQLEVAQTSGVPPLAQTALDLTEVEVG